MMSEKARAAALPLLVSSARPERSITVTLCPASAQQRGGGDADHATADNDDPAGAHASSASARAGPFGQHLTVAHAEADAVFLGAAVVAVGAGRAFLVERRGLLLWRHRVAAGTAENLVTFAKAVGDGDALVENKA
jgi:hypothetical protein